MTDTEREEFLKRAENTITANNVRLDLFDELVEALGKTNKAILEMMPKQIAIDNDKQVAYYNLYHSNNHLLQAAKNI